MTMPDSDRPLRATPIGNRYMPTRRLGRGSFGVVWEATDALTGHRVAVKRIALEPGTFHARVRREVSALRLLRVPGVVPLLNDGINDQGVYLVMEHIAGRPFPVVKRSATGPRSSPSPPRSSRPWGESTPQG